MATAQEEEKPESKDLFAPYKSEITKLQRQLKGYKSQITKYQRKLGETGPKGSDSSVEEPETTSDSREAPHVAPPYDRYCPTCGDANPLFKAPPNVFCNGPSCKGKIPMGHVEPDEIKDLGDGRIELPTIGKCTNCGEDTHAVVEELTEAA